MIARGILALKKAAKTANGGDRFTGLLRGSGSGAAVEEQCDVYVPQVITRTNGDAPTPTLLMRVYSQSELNTITVTLAKAAKNLGGDKYEGDVGDGKFTPYLPQAFSRVDSHPFKQLYISFALPRPSLLEQTPASPAAPGAEGAASHSS
jgi:hypothetical protein